MPRKVEFRAREIARKAGYDPDQLVVEIDQHRDFDLLHIGLAPVNIKNIQPIFMKFINEASRQIEAEFAEERSDSALAPA